MNRKGIVRALGIVALLLAASSVSLGHEVIITYQAKLGNGPELQPGTYRVEIVNNRDFSFAAFYQGADSDEGGQ